MSCELRKKVPQPHRAPKGAERGCLMATNNTTTCTTTTSKPSKVTNAQMMRIATNILAAMPEDALQRVCGEFRAQDVVSKARAHLAQLEKSAKPAGTPSKTRLENEGLARTLVAWWAENGDTAYRAGELANTLSENGALGMVKVSTQKVVGILNVAVDLGMVTRTFDGKSGWYFSLTTDETPDNE